MAHKVENVTLKVEFADKKNRAGQTPITVKLLRNGAVFMTIFGMRFLDDAILESSASLPGGNFVRHTECTPGFQSELIRAKHAEAEA